MSFIRISGRHRKAGFIEFYLERKGAEILVKGKVVEPWIGLYCDIPTDCYFASAFETVVDLDNRNEIINSYDNMAKNDPYCITDFNTIELAEEIRNLTKNERARL